MKAVCQSQIQPISRKDENAMRNIQAFMMEILDGNDISFLQYRSRSRRKIMTSPRLVDYFFETGFGTLEETDSLFKSKLIEETEDDDEHKEIVSSSATTGSPYSPEGRGFFGNVNDHILFDTRPDLALPQLQSI